MKAHYGLILIPALALGACSFFTKPTPTVSVPVQVAQDNYATLREIYARLAPLVAVKCSANELTASQCLQLQQTDQQLRALDFEVTRALNNPGVSIDWDHVKLALDALGRMAALVPRP